MKFICWYEVYLLCSLLFLVRGDTSSSTSVKIRSMHKAQSLADAIQHQSSSSLSFHPKPGHKHNVALGKLVKPRSLLTTKDAKSLSLAYAIRVGLAGGLAGAAGTAILYPFDAAKTLRQSDPARYTSVGNALVALCYDSTGKRSLSRAYMGLWTSTIAAIPSSALYFGAYESMKRLISKHTDPDDNKMVTRLGKHAAAAASGNIISSAVFVPKELIKQKMQYVGDSVGRTVVNIIQDEGVRGLYRGFQATLMRNIPSAMLRFVMYEELKRAWHTKSDAALDSQYAGFSWRLFAAGAVAGALASGFMTPFDVLKTRLSTGTCPVDAGDCLKFVIKDQGLSGLYAGAGSRMAFSGAFSAIGFATFEAAKGWLGVSDKILQENDSKTGRKNKVMTSKERRLEHALEDVYEDGNVKNR